MASISSTKVYERLEDMMDQLKKSFPSTLERILREYNHGNTPFFVYTFTKWDYRGDQPQYNVIHQPRRFMADPFWGTQLRKIDPVQGTSEIIWALPHQEGQKMYSKGKKFENDIVQISIMRKESGQLDKLVDEENKKIAKEQGINPPESDKYTKI